MKNLIRETMLIIAGVLFISLAKGTVITVTVMDYEFTPSSFTAQVGDTIEWEWVNGGHTTTSTSVPSGAATWSHPMNSASTSFEYVITIAGKYNYWCAIHTTEMEASFTVTSATGIQVVSNSSIAGALIFSNPSPGQFTVKLKDKQSAYLVKVYDIRGKEIYQSVLSGLQTSINLSSEPDGMYFIYLKSDDDAETVKVLITK